MLTSIPTLPDRMSHSRSLEQALILYSGEKLTISANGTLSQQIEPGATVFLQVKYGLITLIKQEADLCDNLPKVSTRQQLAQAPR
jgi:hypothetical protein